jgi:hypothetical protein
MVALRAEKRVDSTADWMEETMVGKLAAQWVPWKAVPSAA